MSLEQSYSLAHDNAVVSFTAANTTLAKILVDRPAAQQLAAISGESSLPGEASARPRVLWGGANIKNMIASSTDTADKELLVYIGRQLSSSVTGAITSQNLITRTDGGSFVTDGWEIGSTMMMFGETSVAGNNGVMTQLTAVAASTLTVTGTPWTNTTFTGTVRLFKVAQRFRTKIPLSAGNSATIKNVKLLANPNDDLTDLYTLRIGENSALIVAMGSAVSALPCRVDVTADIEKL